MQYFLGFLWGFVLLASFAGWGRAWQRVLRTSESELPPAWGRTIVLGMASVIAVGGFLSALRILAAPMVWLLVLGGLLALTLDLRGLRRGTGGQALFDWPGTRLDLGVLAICILAYAMSVCLSFDPNGPGELQRRYTLNRWDDLYGGYASYPVRILTEGSLGDDSFNDRRSLALGGLCVLQTWALLIFPITYIHIIDPGLSILTVPLVLHESGRRRGWPVWLAGTLTLLCLALRYHWVNASSQLLPTLFLLSLYDSLDELAQEVRPRISGLFKVALVTSAILTLKNNLVPGTCLILGLFVLLDWAVRRDWRRTARAGLLAGSIAALLLLPWFLSSYRAAGTPLYPLLGAGYRAEPMVEYPRLAPVRDLRTEAGYLLKALRNPRTPFCFLLGAVAAAACLRGGLRRSQGIAFLAYLCSGVGVILVFARIFSGGEYTRFTNNHIIVITIISLSVLLGSEENQDWLTRIVPLGSRLLIGLLVGLIVLGELSQHPFVRPTIQMLETAISGKGWNPYGELPEYRRLQESIPSGERFLAFVPMAHLLDFKRNPIDLMDSNCAISPPPGLPVAREAEDMARYFRRLGINWLVARGLDEVQVEDLRKWSENFYKENDSFSGSLVYSHHLMAARVHSLVSMYETKHFGRDLVVVNLGRPLHVEKGQATEPTAWQDHGGNAGKKGSSKNSFQLWNWLTDLIPGGSRRKLDVVLGCPRSPRRKALAPLSSYR